MERALLAIQKGEMGVKLAAKTYNVPKTTLQRMARSGKSIHDLLSTPLGRKPTFSKHLEKEPTEYLHEMENRFWGLTRSDIRSLAF